MPLPQSPETPLEVEVQDRDGIQILRFRNARIFNERNVQELGRALLSSTEAGAPPPRIIVDFQGVSFLSSTAIGKLVTVHRKVKERGGTLALCNIAPAAFEVFRVAHLHDYFQIYSDLNAALDALA